MFLLWTYTKKLLLSTLKMLQHEGRGSRKSAICPQTTL